MLVPKRKETQQSEDHWVDVIMNLLRLPPRLWYRTYRMTYALSAVASDQLISGIERISLQIGSDYGLER